MKLHRHDPARLRHLRLFRRAALGVLAATLCSLPSGILAQQGDVPAAAFHALAINQDFVGVWMTSGEASEDAARARALEMCTRDTGSDACQIVHSGQKNYLAAGYAIDGGLEFMTRNEATGLIQALEAKCTGRFGSTCMVIGMVGPDGAKDFPADPVPAPQRRFGAIAGDFANWVKGNHSDRRVWVVTGAETRKAAQQATLAACEAELGLSRCQLAEANGDSFLLFYQSDMHDFAGFLSEQSPPRALAEMNRRCGIATFSCHAVSMAPVQQSAQYVIDLGARTESETDASSGRD